MKLISLPKILDVTPPMSVQYVQPACLQGDVARRTSWSAEDRAGHGVGVSVGLGGEADCARTGDLGAVPASSSDDEAQARRPRVDSVDSVFVHAASSSSKSASSTPTRTGTRERGREREREMEKRERERDKRPLEVLRSRYFYMLWLVLFCNNFSVVFISSLWKVHSHFNLLIYSRLIV